jgi:glycine cleavage system H protein
MPNPSTEGVIVSYQVPDELRYTRDHEWVVPPTGSGPVRVGVTDFAQSKLGDVVLIEWLVEPGAAVTAGEVFGEINSPKITSELYAPIAGTVVSRNESLEASPEQVNADPYGTGWLIEIEPADDASSDELLDAAGYLQMISEAE